MKKKLFKGILLCAVMAVAGLLFGCAKEQPRTFPPATAVTTVPAAAVTEPEETEAPTTEPETLPPETEPAERRYTLSFVGDCTLGGTSATSYAAVGFPLTIGEDYRYPFENVRSYFEADDFTFANLEGTLTTKGSPQNQYYSFRGSPEYVKILTENSVEAVTLANNHIRDYGQQGYADTIQTLEEAGVSYAEPNAGTIVTLPDGTTIGIYATVFATRQEGVTAGIQALREQGAEIVIYAAHWGGEYHYTPASTQKDMAHAAIDAGANIVYGSHPHVLQPIEEYAGGVIFYSMGNFCFGGNSSPRDYDTAVIQQEVIVSEEGGVELGECTVIPCSISSMERRNNYQPTPYEPDSEGYRRVLRKLGKGD